MKVYRFRKLSSELDYYRLKEIIETGKFWCSNFWELNDPMEGVFSVLYSKEDEKKVVEKINEIHGRKGQYKICSFSGKKGFKKSNMWGCYADGFKGVAIEVEVADDEKKIMPINYNDTGALFNFEGVDVKDENVEKILLNKGNAWKYENEYRFLDKIGEENIFKIDIDNMTAIYFGAPYDGLENTEQPPKDREIFMKYKNFKKKIIDIAKGKIKCFDVKVVDGKVKKLKENLWK